MNWIRIQNRIAKFVRCLPGVMHLHQTFNAFAHRHLVWKHPVFAVQICLTVFPFGCTLIFDYYECSVEQMANVKGISEYIKKSRNYSCRFEQIGYLYTVDELKESVDALRWNQTAMTCSNTCMIAKAKYKLAIKSEMHLCPYRQDSSSFSSSPSTSTSYSSFYSFFSSYRRTE